MRAFPAVVLSTLALACGAAVESPETDEPALVERDGSVTVTLQLPPGAPVQRIGYTYRNTSGGNGCPVACQLEAYELDIEAVDGSGLVRARGGAFARVDGVIRRVTHCGAPIVVVVEHALGVSAFDTHVVCLYHLQREASAASRWG